MRTPCTPHNRGNAPPGNILNEVRASGQLQGLQDALKVPTFSGISVYGVPKLSCASSFWCRGREEEEKPAANRPTGERHRLALKTSIGIELRTCTITQ